ncbi:CAP domain-containing protein [Paraurantiacibacter namhicola]|uniref:Cysteine-rich secretory protein family protein n=1 Tax=Paraurantiacibacter namhicola TaxID=645517 RepID=A0A1C7D974_9SPHN|nr:CAP domain-containing protein [Paraurantiacibacter namhicola]ANU07998.1 Cysteine-rich secretory protein family protein [Paraurantiacibacter namhicola]
MTKGSIIAAVAAAFASTLAIQVAAPSAAEARGARSFAETLLVKHNEERARKGLQRLSWSAKLAGEAQGWANHLARTGKMVHANREQRGGAGENLWMGSAGYYSAEEMIDLFLDERRMFKPGTFPNVSTTGKWADVGHYTQIIWPTTEEVGCAVSKGRVNDFLVCRYWPAGNVMGREIR